MAETSEIGGARGDTPTLRRSVMPDLREPAATRSWVDEQLGTAGLSEHESATVRLLTSELVTNGIEHAANPLELRLLLRDTQIRLELFDGTSSVPVLRDPTPTDLDGRGVLLIDRLASRWGADDTPSGKVVWWELDCAPLPRSQET
ncbi:ATP-binding protein [Actinotalea sp. K2]|uniref:ATP-binding protein n=1 Tax=Actinotalea sp. K2 TaxID=2939438 RepID=UPI002017E5CB|nr:ATP-binding protein [Actinotalea sp. K2]MCL3862373.1 ATP-binding protein [Actinotalea sp. K2]